MDWTLAVLVLVFAIRGLIRGTVAQLFGLLGLLAGLWAAAWTSQWVGQHWHDARPAVVFLALRWLVAALAGLAVASLFQWWGEGLGDAVKGSVVGWLDRLGGFVVGIAVGCLVVVFLVLGVLSFPAAGPLHEAFARAKTTVPILRGGATACAMGGRYVPGSDWLQEKFLSAEKRAVRRSSTPASHT